MKPSDMSEGDLARFVQQTLRQQQSNLPPGQSMDSLTVANLTIGDKVDISKQAKAHIRGITVGTMAAGPPGNPVDGDIWIATVVESTANSSWQFCYKFGDAYPWKFIGGPAVHKADNSGTARANTVDATWEFIAGNPSFTLPRSGLYNYEFGAQSGENSGNQQYVGVGGTFGMYNGAFQALNGGTTGMSVSTVGQASDAAFGGARTLGDVLQLRQYSPSHLNSSISFGWIAITPVAIQ